MRIKEQNINKILFWLLAISALVRGILAVWMEFGNDEVYYWTYALYPDWSHFDHPPMVGWVIQLFSLNLLFDSEFFIRLASVVFMTANTYIIFRIGKELKDAQTGLYAALLFTASIYAFVITGIFIMPDTPLMLFWLLAVWMAIRYFSGLPRFARNDAMRDVDVIARRNDEAIQESVSLDCFVPRNDAKRRIERLHAYVLDLYEDRLHHAGGSPKVLGRMKELWSYLMYSFDEPQDIWRKIKKINALKEYEEAVETIFLSHTLRSII